MASKYSVTVLLASMASKYSVTVLLSILCFTTCLAKESSAQQPRNVVVKGRVFCDTCGQHQLTDTGSPVIVGAVVAVECNMKRKLKTGSTSVEGKTGENGEFRVELSPSVVVHSKCGVRLVSSPQQSCNMPSIATASHITLASNNNGLLTYNSPPLAFRPSSIASCKHKHSHSDADADAESKQSLAPPLLLQAPPLPFAFPPTPPLPNLPFPPPLPLQAPPLAFPLLPPTPPFSVPFPRLAFPTLPAPPPMQ
ncbi:anther-specific protein LAT52 [Cryptomeria japonica]|uniref:anther-specific protein LAT52 n=1 Tax=Cryptomeria japonica TaxID=3369 RepID=UPI0027DA3A5C|nr:anther-specific protein LAT52 [Cryptomeria japonica]